MNGRGWLGAGLLIVAAGLATGCGGGGHGSSGGGATVPGAPPALAPACPNALPVNGPISLCVPENDGVSGTLAFTTSGLPTGVSADIVVSSAALEPQAVRRRIAQATASLQWAMNITETLSGESFGISAPSVTLAGVPSASSVVVELLDQKGGFAVFAYSLPSSTTTESTYLPAPTGGESAATLLASCLDQDTTCYLTIVSGSPFLPAGVPVSSATSTPEPEP